MSKDEILRVLVYLSTLEGFARAKNEGKFLPDDMWDEMQCISELLSKHIKDK